MFDMEMPPRAEIRPIDESLLQPLDISYANDKFSEQGNLEQEILAESTILSQAIIAALDGTIEGMTSIDNTRATAEHRYISINEEMFFQRLSEQLSPAALEMIFLIDENGDLAYPAGLTVEATVTLGPNDENGNPTITAVVFLINHEPQVGGVQESGAGGIAYTLPAEGFESERRLRLEARMPSTDIGPNLRYLHEVHDYSADDTDQLSYDFMGGGHEGADWIHNFGYSSHVEQGKFRPQGVPQPIESFTEPLPAGLNYEELLTDLRQWLDDINTDL